MYTKPNVLFIFSDQQRHDTVSCYGQEPGAGLQLTPHIDELAAGGVRFDAAYTAQPVCGPARAAIQTGRWPSEIGCYVNDRMPAPGTKYVAEWFNEAGYETAYVGKWHLASQYSYVPGDPRCINFRERAVPLELRGGYKDYWIASDTLESTSHSYDGEMFGADMQPRELRGYRADATTDFALEYLTQPKEKPFFLFLSYIEPHHQNDHGHIEGPKGSKERFKNYKVPGDLAGTGGDWREEMPDYLGCCASLDDNVGRLVQCLKEQGLYENTVILYTSDHGCHFRTRNEEYKRSCHENTLHIPLIARGPGFAPGTVYPGMVNTLDMAPTLLHAAGVTPPPFMPGTAIQRLASGEASRRQEVFVQISESCIGRALLTSQYTYCVEAPDYTGQDAPSSDVYVERYLYDNTADPYQKNNLVKQPDTAGIRAALRERLLAAILAAEGKVPVIQQAE